jgi:hypothetical protein
MPTQAEWNHRLYHELITALLQADVLFATTNWTIVTRTFDTAFPISLMRAWREQMRSAPAVASRVCFRNIHAVI